MWGDVAWRNPAYARGVRRKYAGCVPEVVEGEGWDRQKYDEGQQRVRVWGKEKTA